tara:strand:+ start:128 stop:265 length:138 start_codon:yes stop_codon:yes gene_type:complete
MGRKPVVVWFNSWTIDHLVQEKWVILLVWVSFAPAIYLKLVACII